MTWAATAGAPAGWPPCPRRPVSSTVRGGVGPDVHDLKAWMQDHWTAGVACSIMSGCNEAKTYLDTYNGNWVVGRGQQTGAMTLRKGSCYVFSVSDMNEIANFTQTTWALLGATAQFNEGTPAGGWQVGIYTQLWRRSLAMVAQYSPTRRVAANSVRAAILADGGYSTDLASYRISPKDNIAPLAAA